MQPPNCIIQSTDYNTIVISHRSSSKATILQATGKIVIEILGKQFLVDFPKSLYNLKKYEHLKLTDCTEK